MIIFAREQLIAARLVVYRSVVVGVCSYSSLPLHRQIASSNFTSAVTSYTIDRIFTSIYCLPGRVLETVATITTRYRAVSSPDLKPSSRDLKWRLRANQSPSLHRDTSIPSKMTSRNTPDSRLEVQSVMTLCQNT
jgi:hypothetical protein